jgi:hypothetical protein
MIMGNKLLILLTIVLVLHGIIHFLGTTVYMGLGEPQGFAYKTTVLAGQLDLGKAGIWWFGALWLIAGLGTIAAAAGLLTATTWAQPVLLAATLLSLALTLLDWEVAKAGAVIDVIILVALLLAPRFAVVTA